MVLGLVYPGLLAIEQLGFFICPKKELCGCEASVVEDEVCRVGAVAIGDGIPSYADAVPVGLVDALIVQAARAFGEEHLRDLVEDELHSGEVGLDVELLRDVLREVIGDPAVDAVLDGEGYSLRVDPLLRSVSVRARVRDDAVNAEVCRPRVRRADERRRDGELAEAFLCAKRVHFALPVCADVRL